MDTKLILDYINELDFTKHLFPVNGDNVPDIHPDADEVNQTDDEQLMELSSYLEHLHEMKRGFEDSIFQAIPEPSFNAQINIIVSKLQDIVSRYNDYKNHELLSHTLGKEHELLNEMAVDSLSYVKHIISEPDKTEITPLSKPCSDIQTNNETENSIVEEEIISGVRNLAKILGCGVNKAQTIVNSKILEKEGIQWNAGRWKFNKAKLMKFIKDNPDAFTKIKCTR